MATTTRGARSRKAKPLSQKLWREVSRPFRQAARATLGVEAPVEPPYITGAEANLQGFYPQKATVEAEALPMLQKLVRQSANHPGPIVEIGTLLGITTTTIALAKQPHQKVITVDNYGWNAWGFSPETHESITRQMLRYLTETGQVECVKMDKNEFFRTYKGPAPSMVFLDAIHDYPETKKDIEWAKSLGTKIISGHDYCDAFPGVIEVVDEFGGPRELVGTVWVL
jgi:hypothetical protein